MAKIFISIACFMDNDIVNTIEDCLEKYSEIEHLTGDSKWYDEDSKTYFNAYKRLYLKSLPKYLLNLSTHNLSNLEDTRNQSFRQPFHKSTTFKKLTILF